MFWKLQQIKAISKYWWNSDMSHESKFPPELTLWKKERKEKRKKEAQKERGKNERMNNDQKKEITS